MGEASDLFAELREEAANSHFVTCDSGELIALLDTIASLRVAMEAGKQLANVAYNICQRGNADAGALRSLNAAQLAWDESVSAFNRVVSR